MFRIQNVRRPCNSAIEYSMFKVGLKGGSPTCGVGGSLTFRNIRCLQCARAVSSPYGFKFNVEISFLDNRGIL